jgi:GNAT superfamily N-acetyltransferase
MNLGPRLAKLNEVLAIEEIVRQAYSPYIERIGRPPGPMLEDYTALVKESRVSVIEKGGIIQAILVLIPEKNSLLLDNVAVSPSTQGLGLGRRMMEYAEKIALEVGYPSIRLYTNEAMAENTRYYSRLGYVETHRVEERGFKRVYMSKDLS